MSQPTTTPSSPLRIHQPPDGQTPPATVKVPAHVSTHAEIAAAIGAKASRYATSPSPCKGCGRPTLGSFGPTGVEGVYLVNVCQSCKDEADQQAEATAVGMATLLEHAATSIMHQLLESPAQPQETR